MHQDIAKCFGQQRGVFSLSVAYMFFTLWFSSSRLSSLATLDQSGYCLAEAASEMSDRFGGLEELIGGHHKDLGQHEKFDWLHNTTSMSCLNPPLRQMGLGD